MSKRKVWKLKNPETQQVFKSRVAKRLADRQVGDVDDVEVVWGSLKECLLTVAEEVCGKTRGKQRHRETWWWNNEVVSSLRRRDDCSKSMRDQREGQTSGQQRRTRRYMMKQNALQRE